MTNAVTGFRNYLVVTFGYWAFTVTDGAIRMLVVLYFHNLGYSPIAIAFLFLFYEFFGVVTNLVGGWIASHIGLNRTMHIGMALQVAALGMLTVPDVWLTVPYVMFAQALSGIAKDLNKMSAKASVKLLLPKGGEAKLFQWVALLTGSKNSLKGAGYFLGGALLAWIGFRSAIFTLAATLFLVLLVTTALLPRAMGRSQSKVRFRHLFSKTAAINWLSAARFFLFGSRDVWFVIGLPVYLTSVLGWEHTETGGFLALWIIGYGVVQGAAPGLLKKSNQGQPPGGGTARIWAFTLALFPAGIALALMQGWDPEISLIFGLVAFGIVFAINSSVHSFLILAYSEQDKVAMDVGFYYMANAGGRLTGTLLSGWAYQVWGLIGCLWWSVGFVLAAAVLSIPLPPSALSSQNQVQEDR